MYTVRKKTGKNPSCTGRNGSSDPWQAAVYAFEATWPDSERENLTLPKIRALTFMACAAYNLRAPPVHHSTKEYSYYDDARQSLGFHRSHKNKMVALHEVSHLICDRLYGRRAQDHGRAWQGIYFFLLAHAELAPPEALRASARKHGLRWHETPPT